MLILIYIILTAICIFFTVDSKEESNIKHSIIIFLTTLQLLIVYSTYENDGIVDFFSYPISYWLGFFWASLISIIISLYMFIGKIRRDHQNGNKGENK